MTNVEFLYSRFRTENYYDLALVGLGWVKLWNSAERAGLIFKSIAKPEENPLEIKGLMVYRLSSSAITLRNQIKELE